MKSTVIFFRQFLNSSSKPLLYVSIFTIFVGIVPLVNTGDITGLIMSFLLPFYFSFYKTKSAEKGVVAGFSVLCADLVYYSFSSVHFSLVFILIFGVCATDILKKQRISYAFCILFLSAFSIAFIFGMIYPLLYEYLKGFASLIKGRGFIFGTVNNLYDILFSDKLSKLFYHYGYSRTEFINNEAVSGAVDIFKTDSLNSAVGEYLTGKYFVNIFLTLGLFFAVYSKIGEEMRFSFIAVCMCAIITGDVRLLSFFILLYNPVLYGAYLFAVAASYLIPSLIKLNIGFESNGSVIELIRYGNSWGYFLLTGAVLAFLMYFLSRLVISKYALSDGNYYPKRVKEIISFLGNERNIEKVKRNTVIVRNPNLVNILLLDCDIKGNMVSLNEEDLELIREYFQ